MNPLWRTPARVLARWAAAGLCVLLGLLGPTGSAEAAITLTLTSPTPGATVPTTGFWLEGTATSDRTITSVTVIVFDQTAGVSLLSNAAAAYDSTTSIWRLWVGTGLVGGHLLALETTARDSGFNRTTTGWGSVQVFVPGGDSSPPTTPVVTDDGAYTSSSTTLHARWIASDPETGVVEYEYQILQSYVGGSRVVILDWTSAGTATEATRMDLASAVGKMRVSGLVNGATYYFEVRAKNGAGLWSAEGASDGITVDYQPPTVSAIGVTNITATSAALNWTTNEAASCAVRCGTNAPPATQCATTPSGTDHATTLANLATDTTYQVEVICTDAAGNANAAATTSFATAQTPVPSQPSLVMPSGRQLLLQRRNPDGTLAPAVAYTIRGVTWSPASKDTATCPACSNNATVRRPEFGRWYLTDIPLMKAMNVNTIRTFIDFGILGDTGITVDGMQILDEFYRNGIMVVMTVDDAINNTTRAQQVVNRYKNHPAILGWSLGNEWNINYYYGVASSILNAAQRTQTAAALVKSLDANHPVVSSYGEIDIVGGISGRQLADTSNYVNNVCTSADVWSLNIYRGDNFATACKQNSVFSQWASISGKPMFIGEFGTDALRTTVFNPPDGVVDEPAQVQWNQSLWHDVIRHLSASDPALQVLGGTLFEWNDEWWKVGNWDTQDKGGWQSAAFPDGMGNEEYFGIVNIDRQPRQIYSALQSLFDPNAARPAWPLVYKATSKGGCGGYARFFRGSISFFCGVGCALNLGRGFNVAVIDPATGQLLEPVRKYDTWYTRGTGTAMTDMVNFLNSVPNGRMLMIAVADEAGLNFDQSCTRFPYAWVTNAIQTLEALGSTQIRNHCFWDSWAMITVKGEGVARSEQLGKGVEAAAQVTLQVP